MAVARVGITPGSGSGSEINVKVVLSSARAQAALTLDCLTLGLTRLFSVFAFHKQPTFVPWISGKASQSHNYKYNNYK